MKIFISLFLEINILKININFMVFYNKNIRRLILSYSLINDIENKYKPFNNDDSLNNFCKRIVDYIVKKIIQYDDFNLPHFYFSSKDNRLLLYVKVCNFNNNSASLFGKVIIRENDRRSTLSYDLFDINNTYIKNLYKIKKKVKIFNKKKFYHEEYFKFMETNTNEIFDIRRKLNNYLLRTFRKKIYLVYSSII